MARSERHRVAHVTRWLSLAAVVSVVTVTIAASVAGAATRPSLSARYAHSPLSSGPLMAKAIKAGLLPTPGTDAAARPDHLPTILPNVNASGDSRTQPVNEDPITADPNNPQHLLSGGNDYNCSTIQGFYSSNDGGATWSVHCMPQFQFGGCGDPAVAYDLSGNSYIVGLDCSSISQAIFQKSSDNGVTWTPDAVAVHPTFPNGFVDKEWLEADQTPTSPHAGALYISATQFDSSFTQTNISVTHSYDGGATWTTVAVDPVQSFPNLDQFSDLAVGKDGTVYASWMHCINAGSLCGNPAQMLSSKSTDGGNTWSAPTIIATITTAPQTCGYYGCLPNTFERISDIPTIAVDNSTAATAGNLYSIYYTYTGGQMKVMVSRSTNGGSTWGAGVPVAPATATKDQFFPWINVSSTGRVAATWLDRRGDPANLKYVAATAMSADGTSFGQNKPISAAISNPNNDGFGGSFMGDYTGNVWAGNCLHASWMDTSNGSRSVDMTGGFCLG